MNWGVSFILLLDGIANGAVYLLAGLGLVLVFSVTRVVFIPFGDIAAFAALTLASLQSHRLPATIGLVAALAVFATLTEIGSLIIKKKPMGIPRAIAMWAVLPLVPCALTYLVYSLKMPSIIEIAVTILLVIPMGPLMARVVYQPIAKSSVLVLLIVSLALHFLLEGLGLLFFGPEGTRTKELITGSITFGEDIVISAQTILMVVSAIVLSAIFFLVFERTVTGKALRATSINRVGARLVGIRPSRSATLAFASASLLAGFIGVLIAPVTTMYYDSGFLLGLKAFVAAIIAGMTSYPLTAAGALAVGIVESFASFINGALKDVIVFSLLIPVLLLRSYLSVHSDEDIEEED